MQNNWVYEPIIPKYEALLFSHALIQHKGPYFYHPIAVASRKEVGEKYRFLCIAKPKSSPVYSSHFVEIEIYKPVLGQPYATYIHNLNGMF